jgi:DNA-binding NarL/FixJ family response regulator
VIVADDDPLARRTIKQELSEAGWVVLAEAADGREAVELALHYRPELVLMDVVMPVMDGIEATRRIRDAAPEVTVVMLTNSADNDVGMLGLRSGASGYVTKDVEPSRVPELLASTLAGIPALSPALTVALIERVRNDSGPGDGMRPVRSQLTPREWEVADLLSRGLTVEAIADELVLSVETIRTHVKNAYRKLDVHSRDDLVEAIAEIRGSQSTPRRRG